ncbi:sodium/calcium exchanger family protein/calcium-binding EF hand family protein [Abeliophyllum distichum]|uniref:Sodium/calcium exchanger family protein/calcium-binding EF hand family protein n=1 Tax=Abeliophyllum distichum TaxID=126358 RepID=A0ABD1U2A8_9LAMI
MRQIFTENIVEVCSGGWPADSLLHIPVTRAHPSIYNPSGQGASDTDGIDHVDSQYPALTANGYLLSASTCQHTYGFLPCAENAGGYIFQILVYQGLLIFAEWQVSRGSKVLFNIFGNRNFVGIIFRILTSLPAMLMMMLSGVLGSKENAQSLVSLGVGIYAGITVFTLTLQWGICLIVGARKLGQESRPDHSSPASCCLRVIEKLTELNDTGIKIDDKTRYTAGIMLLSLIPYVIVQLVDIFNTSHIVILIALIVSFSSLVSYFIYQECNPWIQERSLEYVKYEILRKAFLQYVERRGKLIDEDGNPNLRVINNFFAETDKDANGYICSDELEKLMNNFMPQKMNKKSSVSRAMEKFDTDKDDRINRSEFTKACIWIAADNNVQTRSDDSSSRDFLEEEFQQFNQMEENKLHINQILSKILKHYESKLLKEESFVTDDGEPNTESIKKIFRRIDINNKNKITRTELEQQVRTIKFEEVKTNYEDVVKEFFNYFDTDGNNTIDEENFVYGLDRWLRKAILVANCSDKTKSIDEYDKLSYTMRVPSFSISFVIVPLAMNTRTAIEALFPAGKKSEKTASLTFSEIYGEVVMNNLSGLTILLAIVYTKDLQWDFSAEVLIVLVVCAIVGILGYSSTKYPFWTCILAFLLYPISLGLFIYDKLDLRWN